MNAHRHLLAASLGLVLLLSAGAAAHSQGTQKKPQTPPKPQASAAESEDQGFFVDTVNVSVVNVDVYVTDKKGNRINGLTQDDFEIFEDGRPVAITNFFAVQDGKAVSPQAEEAAEPAPSTPGAPAPPPGTERPKVPEDQRLRLVVYIDNFNIHPFNRNRVMGEIRAFLNQHLSRDDQVMLVSYDRSLHIRNRFTSDPGIIAAGLTELEKVSGHAVHHDSERRDVLNRIEDSRNVNEALSYARTYAQSTYNDLAFSIDGLKQLVDSLAGLPGRKAVLYVSDGLPMIAGQDVFYAVQSKYSDQSTGLTEQFEFDTSRRFNELTAQANANRITFYTIDAAGLRVYSSVSAENQSAGQGVYIDSVQISNLQSTLQTLAEKTGGVAIINANRVMPQLERIARDFNSYYSLGYSPVHSGDGRYHKIEVKLKQRTKGLLVRHREGYRDKNTEARMSDGTLAALNFAVENNPLGVELELGQPTRREDGFYLLPVVVRIPIGKLVLVPRDGKHEARVRLFIAAIDGSGNTSDVQQVPVPISIPEADLATATRKSYTYSVSLLMRSGNQKVAVGVRDDIAAEASFVTRELRVGP